MRRLLVLIAVVSLFTVFAVPASAGAPVIFEDEDFEWTDELNPWLSAECGFDVYSSGSESLVVKGFFDNHDELLRVEVHINGTSMEYKEGGTVLIDRYSFHVTEDIADETTTLMGTVWNVHAPGTGSGVVINDSGLITFAWEGGIIKAVGPKDSFEDGWVQDFCDALDS